MPGFLNGTSHESSVAKRSVKTNRSGASPERSGRSVASTGLSGSKLQKIGTFQLVSFCALFHLNDIPIVLQNMKLISLISLSVMKD